MLCSIYVFCLFLICGTYGQSIATQNMSESALILMDNEGDVVPLMEASLNLDFFDENSNLTKRSDDDWLTDVQYISMNELIEYNGSIFGESLVKRTNMQECIWFVSTAGSCVYKYWDYVDGVWQAGYDIYRMTHTGGCRTVMGNKGSFYYKYYPTSGSCGSTIQQKTIAGALEAAIEKLEGDYLCNIYLFHVNHHGKWHGDIIIGAGASTWYTSAKKTTYKGCLNVGCKGLQAPYNCNSRQEGA